MCFGGGSSSAPTPTPPPPPPSKMDENAAGRQAAVDQIRAGQTSGFPSTITGAGNQTTTTKTSAKQLLGS